MGLQQMRQKRAHSFDYRILEHLCKKIEEYWLRDKAMTGQLIDNRAS